MASKVELIGGNFQDLQGNLLALGYIKMKLSSDEEVNDSLICSGIEITITLDSNGNCVAGQYVWGNDAMLPVNSYYKVTVYSAQGQIVWGPNNQQVAGIGPFDVGTWVPNSVISWSPSVQSLAVEVAGTTFSSQNLLDFVNTGNVIFTDLGNGQISASAPAPPPPSPSLPYPTTKRFALWETSPGTQNFFATNDTSTGGGSGGSIVTGIAASSTGYPAIKMLTSAGNNLSWGLYFGTSFIYAGRAFVFEGRSGVSGGFTGSRLWTGVCDTLLATTDNPTTSNILAFRYNSQDSAHWSCVSGNGVATTVVDSGIIPTLESCQQLSIVYDGSTTANFYINSVLVATITTTLPVPTSVLLLVWSQAGNGFGGTNGGLVEYLYAETNKP